MRDFNWFLISILTVCVSACQKEDDRPVYGGDPFNPNSDTSATPNTSGASTTSRCDGPDSQTQNCPVECSQTMPCPSGQTCKSVTLISGESINICGPSMDGGVEEDSRAPVANGTSVSEPNVGDASFELEPSEFDQSDAGIGYYDSDSGALPMQSDEPNPRCNGPTRHNAPRGDYSPATRISSLEIPRNVASAVEAGCDSVGSNHGTGLSTLFALVGDSNSLVQQNENGEYDLLILAHLTDWSANENGNFHTLEMYTGEYRNGSYYIGRTSFENNDTSRGARHRFAAQINECRLTTNTGSFDLRVDDDLFFDFALSAATVNGEIFGNNVGFGFNQMVLSGYLTNQAIESLVEGMQIRCASDNPPSVCGAASAILDGDDAVSRVASLMKGYDTRLENDRPVQCDKNIEGDCNAVSVCLKMASEPVTISGISPN